MSIVLQRARYDIYSAGLLAKELRALRDRDSERSIDLRNVRQLDACSLGQLVRALNEIRATDKHATLRLLNVDANLGRIFRIAKLDEVFRIDDPLARAAR